MKSRLEIYEAFERAIASYENRLAEVLELISSTDSPAKGDAKYADSIKKAAILTCFVKRRSYLSSLVMEGRASVSFNEFAVYIDEMAELARLSGIECLTYCDLTGEIRLSRVIPLYDFWASLLEWAVVSYSEGIVLQTISGDGLITMRLRMSGASLGYRLPDHIASASSALGGMFEMISDAENLAILRFSIPAECLSPERGRDV
jgi:hypothetical protein